MTFLVCFGSLQHCQESPGLVKTPLSLETKSFQDRLRRGIEDFESLPAQDHRATTVLQAILTMLVDVTAPRISRAAHHNLVDLARARPLVITLARAAPRREEQVIELAVSKHEPGLGRVRVSESGTRRRVPRQVRDVFGRVGLQPCRRVRQRDLEQALLVRAEGEQVLARLPGALADRHQRPV